MDVMKKLFLFLWMMVILLPLGAQEQYISKGRYTPEDRFEDLGGGGGILLLSKHRDLVVTLTNVEPGKFKVTPNGERPDGYYEYIVPFIRVVPVRRNWKSAGEEVCIKRKSCRLRSRTS